MKNLSDEILKIREDKRNFIESFILDYQVITLHANIPGLNKQSKEAYFLVNIFDNLIMKEDIINRYYFDSVDGPYIVYLCSLDQCLKDRMVLLEEQHYLGRFVDIDVYYKNNVSLSRGNLRKCYICGDAAFICGRTKKHSVEELNNFIYQSIKKYSLELLTDIINESMMMELSLEPKFGLVTPSSNGSHKDMDFSLMKKTIDGIGPYISEYFIIGYDCDNLDDLFTQLRRLGKDIEKQMFEVSGGVNCYKGFVFASGIILGCIGYKISKHCDESIFELCECICQGITDELKDGNDTYGKICYQKYGITGARGEAERGFINVRMILDNYSLDTNDSLLAALIKLISLVDDTILLKRCRSYEMYLDVKAKFNGEINIDELNEYCLNNNLSFGGSADLLICAILIKKLKKIMEF